MQPLAVTCSVGHRAGLAASILRRHGFAQVHNVLGGMTAWTELELPTVKVAQNTVTTPQIEGERATSVRSSAPRGYYENPLHQLRPAGQGEARFLNPSGTITAHPLRYGVLSRSSGMPEVTTTGHWLRYNEGIGDPQVEQLTYPPGSKKVGDAWPFSSAGCPF